MAGRIQIAIWAVEGIGDDSARRNVNALDDDYVKVNGDTIPGDSTVDGTLDVGVRHDTCSFPSGERYGNCSCADDEVVVGGGTATSKGQSIRKSSSRVSG